MRAQACCFATKRVAHFGDIAIAVTARKQLLGRLYGEFCRETFECRVLRAKGGLAVVEDLVEFLFDRAVASGDSLDHRLKSAEIVEFVIEQVRRCDLRYCVAHQGWIN